MKFQLRPMLQNVCRRVRLRSLSRYHIEIAEYLERVYDGRGEESFFPGRNIGTQIGPSGPRTFDTEFFHSRLQSGALESEAFGCAAFSTDFPVARRQHFFHVCSFNFFDGFAALLMGLKRIICELEVPGEPVVQLQHRGRGENHAPFDNIL